MSDSIKCFEKLIKENSEILKKFEEWIGTQPHIPKNIPKVILIRYWKVCNFDLEKAKKLLDTNVKFRIKNQYLFTDRDVDSAEFRRAIETVQYTAFPKLTREGYSIESYRIVSSNLENFILMDIFKAVYMIHDMDTVIQSDTNGQVGIYDAKGFTFQHFMKLLSHVPTVMHFLQYGQEATCIDVKQIHVVNCSQIVSKVVSFFKSFMSKELRESMHFHSSGFETLHNFIDKECLPTEFGGCVGTLDEYMENTLNNLYKNRDFVTKNENFFLLGE